MDGLQGRRGRLFNQTLTSHMYNICTTYEFCFGNDDYLTLQGTLLYCRRKRKVTTHTFPISGLSKDEIYGGNVLQVYGARALTTFATSLKQR